MSSTYTLAITRKEVTYGVKKNKPKPDETETAENSGKDTAPKEKGDNNNSANKNLDDSSASATEEEDSRASGDDESTSLSKDELDNDVIKGVTYEELMTVLMAPDSDTEEENGEQFNNDTDTGRQQSSGDGQEACP